ncbi:MAG: hypothetical protein ACLUQ6_11470 [Alistipes onderdonkii]
MSSTGCGAMPRPRNSLPYCVAAPYCFRAEPEVSLGFRLHSQQQAPLRLKKSFHSLGLFVGLLFFNDNIIAVPGDKVTFFPDKTG